MERSSAQGKGTSVNEKSIDDSHDENWLEDRADHSLRYQWR